MASFDILIRRGTIVDGTGKPSFQGDIGIQGDRIFWVRPSAAPAQARKVIDAKGLVVTPGFTKPLPPFDIDDARFILPVLRRTTVGVSAHSGIGASRVAAVAQW